MVEVVKYISKGLQNGDGAENSDYGADIGSNLGEAGGILGSHCYIGFRRSEVVARWSVVQCSWLVAGMVISV